MIVEKGSSSRKMGRCAVERIDTETFAARHREVAESFSGVLALTVVMGQDLGHFGQAIAAAALDFLRYFQMQCPAPFRQQAFVQSIFHQSVLECVTPGRTLCPNEIELGHGDETRLQVWLAYQIAKQIEIKTSADSGRGLQN